MVKCLRQMTKTAETVVAAPPARDRELVTQALLDAAERLLVSEGYAAISTRRLAQEAGVNHGLVHYYFGSMEELLVQVLERFTARLIARQREMYGADEPFIERWRTAWRFHEADLAAGYPKIWHELQAMAWNKPELRDRLMAVNLKSVFLMSKAALAHMVPRRSGVIVNAGSIAGLRAIPDRAAYVASKFGVVGLTRTMALDHV